MSILIRNYVDSDLPELKRITVEAFSGVSIDRRIEEDFGIINGHDWRWRKARHIDDDVRRNRDGVFVAEETGRVLGYITTWIDVEAGLGFIPNLAVDAEQRGQGLGRRLIEYALDYFRRNGVSHVRIETLAHNEIGQHLYPACGFREVTRQIHYCMCLDERKERVEGRERADGRGSGGVEGPESRA